MDALLVLGAWLCALLLIIFVLLFGQNAAFAHTPLPRLHWLVTQGLCHAVRSGTQRAGGRRAAAALEHAGHLCCERSNPAVQLLFLAMFVTCYGIFFVYIFPWLPVGSVSAMHKYTGTAAALGCLAVFVVACYSDPGTITAANAAAHAALYPHDDLVYEAKQCWTCGVPCPARSKHCRTCGRCIARMDHHCIWINSCVGLLNMRWFLGFLLSTAAICFYAAIVGFRVVRAHMALQGAWNKAFIDPDTEQLVHLSDSRQYILRYLSAYYGPQVAVTFFAGAAGWIVLGFTGYQLWLVCAGLTTNEVHKRRQLVLARQLEAEQQQMEARVEAALAGRRTGSSGSLEAGAGAGAAAAGATGAAGGSAASQRQQQQQRAVKRQPQISLPNHYNRGAWRNLSEVLFPEFHLRQAAAAAANGSSGSSPGGGKKRS